MNEPFQEIVHVDGCFDLMLGGILFVLFCVILVTFALNLRFLLRPTGGADEPALFGWRLRLSLAASCIAGMLAVLAAIQALIFILYLENAFWSQIPQAKSRILGGYLNILMAGWCLATVGMIQYFGLNLWSKRRELKTQ
jgi:hypothetical protein